MTRSFNAWLMSTIDDYKAHVRDATVDFFMAEAPLKRAECTVQQLKHFNGVSLDMANLCFSNGDDESYLHALNKLHNRLISEINNSQRCQLFRTQSYHFARHTLTLICQQYAREGTWSKANAFQKDFANRVRHQF